MIELLLQKLPVYLGFFLLAAGLAGLFAFRRSADKRDEAFKREAVKLLDALDAERRRHTKMYSIHREIERRNVFDDSNGNKQ